jgi:hypothetical protein
MAKQTYLKSRLRWAHNAEKWAYYKRVIGVGVDCNTDVQGYFINSDGSKTLTSDENAALILLFARTLASRKQKLAICDKLRHVLAKLLLEWAKILLGVRI